MCYKFTQSHLCALDEQLPIAHKPVLKGGHYTPTAPLDKINLIDQK